MQTMTGSLENTSLQYEMLKVGEVMPEGWLLRQMDADLNNGIAGAYESISRNVGKNLFAKQSREAGTWVAGGYAPDEKAWWAGEHEGYWMDGIIRMSVFTGSEHWLKRSQQWVADILSAYESSGYIGIYSPETRFPKEGFDGELWTQSRAYQALFAWYEYSGDEKVISAIEDVVHSTIDYYRELGTYFSRSEADGGVAHGVGYIDTLEYLWRLTRKKYYADAAVWLYMDFCDNGEADKDISYKNLHDSALPWQEHTPHTAESLHMPGIAAFFSNMEKLKTAALNVYSKLERHSCPGGGFVAGKLESIAGVDGGGDEASEYCGMTEGLLSLNRIFMYDANLFSGMWGERVTLNAAMGARFHPENSAMIYLSRDNRLKADSEKVNGGREVFAATHGAACCSLNSIRQIPAYVEGMWYKTPGQSRLLVNLYGACRLDTIMNGNHIKVVEDTQYPFSDRVVFKIELEEPAFFELALRVPPNSGKIKVKTEQNAKQSFEGGLLLISNKWQSGAVVEIDFDFQVKEIRQHDSRQAYYQWGPLVFSLPFIAQKVAWRNFEPGDFKAYYLSPEREDGWGWLIDPEAGFVKTDIQGDTDNPWEKPTIALKGTLLDDQRKPREVVLMPLGHSQLRRTTFPLKQEYISGQKNVSEFSDMDDPMLKF